MDIAKLQQAVESVNRKMRVSRYPTHDELNTLLAAARLVIRVVEENAQRPRVTRGCPNCGRPGSHFVPPMFGEEGFYICHGGR
jgi:hypothetical protein